MNRLGFNKNEIDDTFKQLKEMKGLEYEGIFSHFATSDEVDKTYSKKQYEIKVSSTCDWGKLGRRGSNINEFFEVISSFYT